MAVKRLSDNSEATISGNKHFVAVIRLDQG
jgi:hypothetical protein